MEPARIVPPARDRSRLTCSPIVQVDLMQQPVMEENAPVSAPIGTPRVSIVATDRICRQTDRLALYLQANHALHLRGAAGTGKTLLALRVAAASGRPVSFITGAAAHAQGGVLGGHAGVRTKQIVDRLVPSLTKTETETALVWFDHDLTAACRHGHVLVYDEFTRAPAGANDVLLSVLEERLLVLPAAEGERSVVSVHPDFRMVLTSNPHDRASVANPSTALLDRLMTVDLSEIARGEEIEIVSVRTGLDRDSAGRIVDLVRDVRKARLQTLAPTIRASLMIAGIVKGQSWRAAASDERFVALCHDVLLSKIALPGAVETGRQDQSAHAAAMLDRVIEHYCPADDMLSDGMRSGL